MARSKKLSTQDGPPKQLQQTQHCFAIVLMLTMCHHVHTNSFCAHLHNAHCTLHTAQCCAHLHSAQCTMLCTLHTAQCCAQCTMHTAQCCAHLCNAQCCAHLLACSHDLKDTNPGPTSMLWSDNCSKRCAGQWLACLITASSVSFTSV